MKETNAIIHNGTKMKPSGGVYRCPYKCGDKRYPRKSWKTEKGMRMHLDDCPMSPDAVAKRDALAARRNERKEDEDRRMEINRAHAMAKCPYLKGDRVFCVQRVITKPTHEQRGSRMVRVRYEEVREYHARVVVVEGVRWTLGGYIINGGISERDLCGSIEQAEARAEIQTRSDEARRGSASSYR